MARPGRQFAPALHEDSDMSEPDPLVIIGTGLAGYTLAREFIPSPCCPMP